MGSEEFARAATAASERVKRARYNCSRTRDRRRRKRRSCKDCKQRVDSRKRWWLDNRGTDRRLAYRSRGRATGLALSVATAIATAEPEQPAARDDLCVLRTYS